MDALSVLLTMRPDMNAPKGSEREKKRQAMFKTCKTLYKEWQFGNPATTLNFKQEQFWRPLESFALWSAQEKRVLRPEGHPADLPAFAPNKEAFALKTLYDDWAASGKNGAIGKRGNALWESYTEVDERTPDAWWQWYERVMRIKLPDEAAWWAVQPIKPPARPYFERAAELEEKKPAITKLENIHEKLWKDFRLGMTTCAIQASLKCNVQWKALLDIVEGGEGDAAGSLQATATKLAALLRVPSDALDGAAAAADGAAANARSVAARAASDASAAFWREALLATGSDVEPERVATLLLGAARAFDAASARVARVEGELKTLARTTDARAWHVLQIVGVGLKQHRDTLAKDKTQLIQLEVIAAAKRTLGLPLPPEPASASGDTAAGGEGEGEEKDAAGGGSGGGAAAPASAEMQKLEFEASLERKAPTQPRVLRKHLFAVLTDTLDTMPDPDAPGKASVESYLESINGGLEDASGESAALKGRLAEALSRALARVINEALDKDRNKDERANPRRFLVDDRFLLAWGTSAWCYEGSQSENAKRWVRAALDADPTWMEPQASSAKAKAAEEPAVDLPQEEEKHAPPAGGGVSVFEAIAPAPSALAPWSPRISPRVVNKFSCLINSRHNSR